MKSRPVDGTPGASRSGSLPGRFAAAAAAALVWTAVAPATVTACPSCYGSASGPVIDGMNAAVLVMLGVTGAVLSWIAAFAVRVARRERSAAGREEQR